MALAAIVNAGAAQRSPRISEPQSIRSGPVEVQFWPQHRLLAERTLRAATAPLRLPGITPAAPAPRATVVLAPTPSTFDSLTHGAPHWSAGVAVPAERRIVLPAFSSARTPLGDPLIALRHELVHLALNAAVPGRVPRWF